MASPLAAIIVRPWNAHSPSSSGRRGPGHRRPHHLAHRDRGVRHPGHADALADEGRGRGLLLRSPRTALLRGPDDLHVIGPVVVMALEAPGAIAKWRAVMGATDPARRRGHAPAPVGTSIERNATHGSDARRRGVRGGLLLSGLDLVYGAVTLQPAGLPARRRMGKFLLVAGLAIAALGCSSRWACRWAPAGRHRDPPRRLHLLPADRHVHRRERPAHAAAGLLRR